MDDHKHILLICGGGGTEHDISLVSANYIDKQLQNLEDATAHLVTIMADGDRLDRDGEKCELRKAGELAYPQHDKVIKLSYALPCFHGPPGETGTIQSVFDLMGLPY